MKNGRYEEENKVCWYKNDKIHREDGPAIEHNNGDTEWWINGKLHREDGPAYANIYWYLNGELHREDGPAILSPLGYKQWWINGIKHREDGPAIEFDDGSKEWYLNNLSLTEAEFNQWLNKKNLHEKLQNNFTQKHKDKTNKI